MGTSELSSELHNLLVQGREVSDALLERLGQTLTQLK